MSISKYLIVDVATTAIPGVEAFMEEPTAPSNYKDQAKIDAYIADQKARAAEKCALDLDLGRITAIGIKGPDYEHVMLAETEADEPEVIRFLAEALEPEPTIVTFNGHRFDLPCVMRRSLYCGVKFPYINLDRYRSPHLDVSEILTMRGLMQAHSLGFYVKRLGWTDLVKPLSGQEEARVPVTGQWAELKASVVHDLNATARLASWLGVIAKAKVMSPEQEMVGF
jgi:hypothetical protein